MKKTLKRILSAALCIVLLTGLFGVPAFAVSAEDYEGLDYDCYTYLGDSVSWGYGLDEGGTDGSERVFERVNGAFTDLVGDVLEELCGAEVHSASCSGTRMSDFRAMLELGMGLENPYPGENDWYGNRHPERAARFLSLGKEACDYIRKSDLISLEVGLNDLTGTLVNTLSACGFIDLGKLTAISDVNSALEYIAFALDSIGSVDILNSMLAKFNEEIVTLRENSRIVLKHIVELAPDDADIIFMGYYNATANLKIIPGSSTSIVCDFLSALVFSLNDYFRTIAEEYDNVYFVEEPNVKTFFEEGTDVVDLLGGEVDFLKGIHPNAEGHETLAKAMLDALVEINTCHHEHTTTSTKTVKLGHGYEYIRSTVCTDCGKVLDMGSVVTPLGTVKVPVSTVTYVLDRVEKLVTATAKTLGSLFSLFK